MFPNLSQNLERLDGFNLDSSECLITGGAVLAIHGIRDCHDLDIVCSEKLAAELQKRFPNVPVEVFPICRSMFIDNIEFMLEFNEEDRPWSTTQQIKEADIINGKRYQTLEKVKFFKKQQNRPKDIEDIRLIQAYESQL